jgi:SAM-dependent methyltransferase
MLNSFTAPADLNVIAGEIESQYGNAARVAGFGQSLHFAEVARDMFMLLIDCGLMPHHKVCDIGCGVLRLGFFLTRFLDDGCYFGTEVRPETVEIGRRHLLGPHLAEKASVKFDGNYDLSIFGEKFDFVIARSIWSHTPKVDILRLLDSFAQNSTSGGVLLASCLPAAAAEEDYSGDKWSGPVIRHFFYWITAEARRRDLITAEITSRNETGSYVDRITRQLWLRIRHAQAQKATNNPSARR